MAREVPAINTIIPQVDMFTCLGRSWFELFQSVPSRESIAVLWAHWAHETGRGKSCIQYNIGNIKYVEGKWDGDFTQFTTHEILSTERAKYWKNWAVENRTPRAVKVVKTLANNKCVVYFYPCNPPNPVCSFRAYPSLLEGTRDYLSLLKSRFSPAWPAVESGEILRFTDLLYKNKYFTADPKKYGLSLQSLQREILRRTSGLYNSFNFLAREVDPNATMSMDDDHTKLICVDKSNVSSA